MSDELATGAGQPRWRVRTTPLPWWRRWFDRTLAQADVVAPDGAEYHVRLLRAVPLRRSPLGPADNFVPHFVSLPVLIGANLYELGQTRWFVQVVKAETPWRAARVVYTRRMRGGPEVADVAIDLVWAVSRGEKPWEADEPGSTWGSVRKLMDWE